MSIVVRAGNRFVNWLYPIVNFDAMREPMRSVFLPKEFASNLSLTEKEIVSDFDSPATSKIEWLNLLRKIGIRQKLQLPSKKTLRQELFSPPYACQEALEAIAVKCEFAQMSYPEIRAAVEDILLQNDTSNADSSTIKAQAAKISLVVAGSAIARVVEVSLQSRL